MKEYEVCAKYCDKVAEARMKQSLGAKAQKLRTEARDFESMAMQARQLANDFREMAGSDGTPIDQSAWDALHS